jgi:hypothetical protein
MHSTVGAIFARAPGKPGLSDPPRSRICGKRRGRPAPDRPLPYGAALSPREEQRSLIAAKRSSPWRGFGRIKLRGGPRSVEMTRVADTTPAVTVGTPVVRMRAHMARPGMRKPGVEFPREIRTRRLQYFVRTAQLTHFAFQLHDPGPIISGSARPRPTIDFSLPNPAARRFGMNTQLPAHPGQLTPALPIPRPDLQDHPHRALAQLLGYFRCAGMTLHPSRDQSLQDHRGGPGICAAFTAAGLTCTLRQDPYRAAVRCAVPSARRAASD